MVRRMKWAHVTLRRFAASLASPGSTAWLPTGWILACARWRRSLRRRRRRPLRWPQRCKNWPVRQSPVKAAFIAHNSQRLLFDGNPPSAPSVLPPPLKRRHTATYNQKAPFWKELSAQRTEACPARGRPFGWAALAEKILTERKQYKWKP